MLTKRSSSSETEDSGGAGGRSGGPGHGEDLDGVQIDAGRIWARSTPARSCGCNVETRIEMMARRGDSGEVARVDSCTKKIELGHEWVRRDMGRR